MSEGVFCRFQDGGFYVFAVIMSLFELVDAVPGEQAGSFVVPYAYRQMHGAAARLWWLKYRG